MFNEPAVENKRHNHNSILEILLFTSPLCGPCPKLEQRVKEAIKRRNLPVKLTKIDVLSAPEIAEKHNIIACPTLVFPEFVQLCGCHETEILEELISTYFASSFEF